MEIVIKNPRKKQRNKISDDNNYNIKRVDDILPETKGTKGLALINNDKKQLVLIVNSLIDN